MGNRALRKQVIKAMREAGVRGKLYYGDKNIARKHFNAVRLRELLYILSLKPGTLVNDCDAFNHRVKKPLYWYGRWDKNTSVLIIDQLEFDDGHYSCGCPGGPGPALSRDEIEKKMIHTDEEIAQSRKGGWWSEKSQAIENSLRAGKHICDENGILLDEFRRTECH